MTNDIDWNDIEEDFARGWRIWATNGYVDSDCMCEGERVSSHVLDGYEAAARANERGGARPTCADAAEAAAEYVADAMAEWNASYNAYTR